MTRRAGFSIGVALLVVALSAGAAAAETTAAGCLDARTGYRITRRFDVLRRDLGEEGS